jgi:hypothetical protein
MPDEDRNDRSPHSNAGAPRRTRRAHRRQGIVLHPPKLVPLDLEHERESLAALTELLRVLLERHLAADE